MLSSFILTLVCTHDPQLTTIGTIPALDSRTRRGSRRIRGLVPLALAPLPVDHPLNTPHAALEQHHQPLPTPFGVGHRPPLARGHLKPMTPLPPCFRALTASAPMCMGDGALVSTRSCDRSSIGSCRSGQSVGHGRMSRHVQAKYFAARGRATRVLSAAREATGQTVSRSVGPAAAAARA